MGLYSLQGTISRLGQCEFDNDLVIYAYVEITTHDENRRLLKRSPSLLTSKRRWASAPQESSSSTTCSSMSAVLEPILGTENRGSERSRQRGPS